jgi:hypothetical protein
MKDENDNHDSKSATYGDKKCSINAEEIGNTTGTTGSNRILQHNLRDEFETNGFVCLKSAIPSDCIRQLHGAALLHAEYIFEVMSANGHLPMSIGVKHGFREVVLRSPGRYEMSVQNRHWNATTQEIIISSAKDFHAIKTDVTSPTSSVHHQHHVNNISNLWKKIHEILLLSDSGRRLINLAKSFLLQEEGEKGDEGDIYTCNMSVVIAEPGAAEQKWHADGGHLSMTTHLPCHCLNIFLPLVAITEELGPTELRPGKRSTV